MKKRSISFFPTFSSKLRLTIMESALFVPSKLTFSENLRCLNLPLLVGAVSQNRSLFSRCFVIAGQSIHRRKFKHLKYSENIIFAETNNVDSILVFLCSFPDVYGALQ